MTKNVMKKLVLTSLFTSLMGVSALIKIPIGIVPITLQTMVCITSGFLLGKKYGTLSIVLYIVLGLIGLPVFSNGGGLGYIFQPTFGYLIGMIFASFIAGYIKCLKTSNDLNYRTIIITSLFSLVIIYIFGIAYFILISLFYLKQTIDFVYVFFYCFLFTIGGDIITIFIGGVIIKRVLPLTTL